MIKKNEFLKELSHRSHRKSNRIILNALSSPVLEISNRRSNTMPTKSMEKLLDKVENPKKTEQKSPLKTASKIILASPTLKLNPIKVFHVKLKSRFKDVKFCNKRIPQSDYLVFLLEKIPTFDIAREKNIKKNNRNILSLVNPIIEDQNECSFEHSQEI